MGKHFQNVLAGMYFDHCATEWENRIIENNPALMVGSAGNPLEALRFKTWDADNQTCYSADDLANALAIPVEWFGADFTGDSANAASVIQAIGKMALVAMSCERNGFLVEMFESEITENPLEAPGTLAEVVEMQHRGGELATA